MRNATTGTLSSVGREIPPTSRKSGGRIGDYIWKFPRRRCPCDSIGKRNTNFEAYNVVRGTGAKGGPSDAGDRQVVGASRERALEHGLRW